MIDDASLSLYEQPALREALGGTLRPGGLALTDEVIAASYLAASAWVLDVGCGSGATVAHLRCAHQLDAVGIDASQALLDAGHARTFDLPLICGWGEQLPLGDMAFDAVLVECVLSLVPDVDRALAEFRRVLKPGGLLLLADLYLRSPGVEPPPRPAQPISCLHGAMSRPQIEERLADQGFDVDTWQDRSRAVKEFAARLILAGISPALFWDGGCEGGMDAVTRRQPGYFWLVAHKTARR